jgi:saccharopine dehydrogenase (NAD+, L-lysine-forming)
MTTIFILGGYGETGRLLAHYLLQETDCRLILAGRHPEKAQALADELNRQVNSIRVESAFADAADIESLGAFNGADLVVAASSTAVYCENVARAALAAGADYLDIQYSRQKAAVLRRLAPEIEHAGRCFITDGGFHPGLPAALVRYAASCVGRLEEAIVGSVISADWASFNLGQETMQEFTREFIDFDSRVFHDGRWQELSAISMMAPKTLSFGPPFGRRACIAMPLDEMDALPQMIPTLHETGFYIAGFNGITDWIISPLVVMGLKISPERMIGPMSRLLFWSMRRFARPPFGAFLKLEALGETDGKPHTLAARLFHEDGYVFTAVPVVACILQWLTGDARVPGVWHQAHIVDSERLLRDMADMGIDIDVTEHVSEREHHLQPAI